MGRSGGCTTLIHFWVRRYEASSVPSLNLRHQRGSNPLPLTRGTFVGRWGHRSPYVTLRRRLTPCAAGQRLAPVSGQRSPSFGPVGAGQGWNRRRGNGGPYWTLAQTATGIEMYTNPLPTRGSGLPCRSPGVACCRMLVDRAHRASMWMASRWHRFGIGCWFGGRHQHATGPTRQRHLFRTAACAALPVVQQGAVGGEPCSDRCGGRAVT